MAPAMGRLHAVRHLDPPRHVRPASSCGGVGVPYLVRPRSAHPCRSRVAFLGRRLLRPGPREDRGRPAEHDPDGDSRAAS